MCEITRKRYLEVANEKATSNYANYKAAKYAANTINKETFKSFRALRPLRVPQKGYYTLKVDSSEVYKAADLFTEVVGEVATKETVNKINKQEAPQLESARNLILSFLEKFGIEITSYEDYEKRFPEDKSKLENTKGFVTNLGKLIVLKDLNDNETLLEEAAHIAFNLYNKRSIKDNLIKYVIHTSEYKNSKDALTRRYKSRNPGLKASDIDYIVRREVVGQLLMKRMMGRPIVGLAQSMSNWLNTIKNWFNKLIGNPSFVDSLNQVVVDVLGHDLNRFEYNGSNFNVTEFSDNIPVIEKKLDKHLRSLKQRKRELERKIDHSKNDASIKRLSKTIAELEADIEEMDWVKALSTSVKYMMEDTDNAIEYLESKNKKGQLPSEFEILNLRHYLAYYEPFINEVNAILTYNFNNELDQIGEVSEDLKAAYKEFSDKFKVVRDYEKAYTEQLARKSLMDAGMNEEQINNTIHKAKDIYSLSYWIQPARYSSDAFIRVIHKLIKNVLNKVHRETMDFGQDLAKLADELGITNTTNLYEVDAKGNRTGNFVSEFDREAFNIDFAAKQAELHERFGLSDDYHIRQSQKRKMGANELIDYNREWAKWFEENSQTNPKAEQMLKDAEAELSPARFEEFKQRYVKKSGKKTYYTGPLASPSAKYKTSQYASLTKEEKIFLDKILEEKFKIDLHLPVSTRYYKAPQVTQSLTDLVLNRPNDFAGSMKDLITDAFVRKADDSQFGEQTEVRPDSSIVRKVPIFYTKTLPNTNLVSTDAIASMVVYKKMQSNFTNMSKKIPEFENLVEFTKRRKVFKATSGVGVEGGNIANKMENVMEMFAYGMRKSQFEAEVLGYKVDVTKIFEKLARFTSNVNLIGQLYTSASNTISAMTFSKIEDIIGQFTTQDAQNKANLYLAKHLPSAVLETGKIRSENPLNVLLKYMGVKGDASRLYDNADKSTLLRLIKDRGAFASYEAPDYIIKSKIMLALGYEYGVVDGKLTKGAENSILDLLKVRDGKLDFSKAGEDVVNQFTNLVQYHIANVTGELSETDKAAAHQNVIGQLVTVHKGWFFNSIYRRLGEKGYNEMSLEWDEGYWRTTARTLKDVYNNKKTNKMKALSLVWKDLEDWEKANIKRTLLENAAVMLFAFTAYLLNDAAEDDEKLIHLAYIANKSLLEVQALANPYFAIAETTQIAGNPFTVYRTFENMQDATDLIFGNEVIERGRYKGFTKRKKALYQLTPGLKGLSTLRDPEGANRFLKNKPLSWLY